MYFEEPKHDPVSSAFLCNGSSEENFHHLQERKTKRTHVEPSFRQNRNTNARVYLSLSENIRPSMRQREQLRQAEIDTEHCVTELILQSNDRIKVIF